MEDKTMRVDVRRCSACGEDHKGMLFDLLDTPYDFKGVEWTHYGDCPRTGVVVLLAQFTEAVPDSVKEPVPAVL